MKGIDSTAFTLSWCVKFLARYPGVQHELREALKSAFFGPPASDGQRLPPAKDIVTRNIPYLDAFLHETLRFAVTAGSVVRRVMTDAQILGCHVPAGTELVLNTRVLKKPLPVDENLRSLTSREAQEKRRRGGIEGPSGEDLELFNPRRWLYREGDGPDIFDAEALPTLVFSHGIRGCFGKCSPTIVKRNWLVICIKDCSNAFNELRETAWYAGPACVYCSSCVKLRVLTHFGRG